MDPTNLSTSDDVAARFLLLSDGMSVELGEVGDDLDATRGSARTHRANDSDQPTLIVMRTHIGYPLTRPRRHPALPMATRSRPTTSRRTKELMGIPDEPFWAPEDLVDAYRLHARTRGLEERTTWLETSGDVTTSPEWISAWSHGGTDGWNTDIPFFEIGDSVATRSAIQDALVATADHLPGLITGSADLTGSNGTRVGQFDAHTADHPGGRQFHFGIREHAMGSALVGMALHGGTLPVGGTFFVFSDYMRPSIRLAAMSRAPAVFVFTHDSVGVGEDGPTHQPVEQLAALRAIPDLHVVRPADANETVHAWLDAVSCRQPTAIVLSRQKIPVTTDGSAVRTGAGVVHEPAGAPDVLLVATGSEVAVCVDAASALRDRSIAARVVSMPSWDRFESMDDEFRSSVLSPGVPVLSVEAGSTFGWARWAVDSIGIDRFGASAPGAMVLEKLGIDVDHVVRRASALVKANADRDRTLR